MSAVSGEPVDVVAAIHAALRAEGATLAVAESLTGGLLAGRLTDVAGASATFRGGVVAYATAMKATLLGVPPGLLAERGPVDGDVALAMAEGAADRLDATYGLATTGVAGPDPQDGKPVGLAYVAWCRQDGARDVRAFRFGGDRAAIRTAVIDAALEMLREALDA